MSSAPVVYIDNTLVAQAVAKQFHEAAKGCSREQKVEFFGNEGSFSCLVRAVTRRIANDPMIQVGKKSAIRRQVRLFLQNLRKNKILVKPVKGKYAGKWIFNPARMDAVQITSGGDALDFTSAEVASRPSRRKAKRSHRKGRRVKKRGREPYLNSSNQLRPPAPSQPSFGVV